MLVAASLLWSEQLTDFGLRLPLLSLVVFQMLAWGCFSRPRGRGAMYPTSTAQTLLKKHSGTF